MAERSTSAHTPSLTEPTPPDPGETAMANPPMPPDPTAPSPVEVPPVEIGSLPNAAHLTPNASDLAAHAAIRQAQRAAEPVAGTPDPSYGNIQMAPPAQAGERDESVAESRYSRDDIMANAGGFGVEAEVIVGAMAHAGRSALTRSELDKAVAEYLGRPI